jgi:Mn-dependent DtxR family transcriptional regulator
LEDVLGVQGQTALLDACLLEHYVSGKTIDRLIDLIRFFERQDSQDVLDAFRAYRRECESEDSCRICTFNCDVVFSSDDLLPPGLPGENK